MHTEINFLREGEGGAAGKMGRGGMGTRCLTTHICGIVIHVVGWPCHPRQKGSENKPKTRKIQSCWAPQGRPRGLFGVYMDPTTHIWGQVYHSGAFHCWPESKLVKKAKKVKTSLLEKIWIWLGTPNSAFFDPSRWFWGLRAHFQGWGIRFWGLQAILWSKKKKLLLGLKQWRFLVLFQFFGPHFKNFIYETDQIHTGHS